jgi:thiol-disulfide isomerase/thioredoxin
MRPAPRARWVAAAVAVAAAAGCTAETTTTSASSDSVASPFADCAALTAGPAAAASPAGTPASPAAAVPPPGTPAASASPPGTPLASAPVASDAAGNEKNSSSSSSSAQLPAVELPCFTGGAVVRLNAVKGPAVLNVWGSWCGPCRAELPMVQRLAERSKGKLTVLGVDTRDARDAAASFGAEQKISFPMVFDPDQKFLAKLGRANVPLTVFVNAAGRTYVQVQPLDPETLTETVRQHTGVTVTP